MKFCYLNFYLLVIINISVQKSIAQSAIDTLHTDTLTYKNPVFNHDFPDPNLVGAKDGYFYAYSTQASWVKENFGGPYIIPILRSKNLVNWEVAGSALQKKPNWKSEGGIWAPDATYHRHTYFLYYSFSTWGDPNPGIGVATSKIPQGPFTDHGKLFLSKEIGVNNSIDPVLFEEKTKPYLIWGSFNGIYAIRLSKNGTKIKGNKFQIAGNSYEGSYIYKRDKYYYYFGSVGSCCEGAKSTYQVKTGRATHFKGPYIDKEGKPLLENGGTLLLQKNAGEEGFIGPGHNGDIVTDKAGQTWMIYHAFDKKEPTRRVMLIDKINWKDGWPVIDGAQPSIQTQKGPVF